MSPSAVLILENGWIFWGFGIGSKNYAVGELCFNTSQTGYQEILTDPSYKLPQLAPDGNYCPTMGMTGDVNGDSVIDILDVIVVINIVLGTMDELDAADVNDDGIINILDIISIVNIILS